MSTKGTSKCNCNLIKCPNCSVIKMVIMLKNKQQHLKYIGSNGKLNNPVWYNFIKYNNKKNDFIIKGMTRRFLVSEYAAVTNKIIFYDNKTKQLLRTIDI